MRPPLLEAPASVFLILFVQVFMFFCLFFALLYGVAELAFFALIILAMGLGSYFWTQASLTRVSCHISINRKKLFPGEKLTVKILTINAKLLPILFKLHLFVPKAVAGSSSGQWISEENGLLWFQQTAFIREFFPNRRGVFDLGPPRLRGGDLFGFFFKHQTLKDRFEIVVYPRIVNIRSMTVPKREFFGIPGAKSPVEDPVFIFGTRDYQPGRPARSIHWKASARHHRLQEKLCEPATQEKVLLLFDTAGFEDEQAEEDFEKSIEVMASIILQMDRRGIAVGFATNSNIYGHRSRIIPISNMSSQMTVILETLARIEIQNSDDPVTDILAKGYMIPWGVNCIYFAFSQSDQTQAADVFMNRRNTPVQFVMARKPRLGEATNAVHEKNMIYLSDICVPESPER